MRHERFLIALSDSEPCGPDLDEIGDEDYMNYILPAEDRLPARFYDPNTGTVFDRNSMDIRAELKSIDALLERSRDIRLIGLEARFQAFAGSIVGVSDCVQAIAALVETFWDTLHPRPLDEEDPVRQNIIGALDDRARIVLPLHYATIIRDKRIASVTWRQYLIASGATEARDGEAVVSVSDVQQALSSDDNSAAVSAIHESVVKALQAMARVRAIFQERSGYESAPDFGSLKDFFTELRKLLETSRGELASGDHQDDPADAVSSDAADGAAPAASTSAPSPSQTSSAVQIASHREAMAAMGGAEAYFAAYEPSAPALVLVHQARMLVGKPLVEAIEMLLPEAAERAAIKFESGLRFQIGMGHLRTLTQDLGDALAAGRGEADGEAAFETHTRSGATALLAGVEEFYRRAEPSSPIPMLLGKARSYLNSDFSTILNDLIAKDGK